MKHPVYSGDGKTPVRGGTRQRKKADGEVFEMWLENYNPDEKEANDTNESSNEEYRDDNLEGDEEQS